MSQEQLGKVIGVAFQQVQKYEQGANRITIGRLADISRTLEVPVTYFLEGLSLSVANSGGAVEERAFAEFLNSPEAIALAGAWQRIENPVLKSALMDLFGSCPGLRAVGTAEQR